MNLLIFTDGASRGNPGDASYGYIIKDANSGTILHQEGKTIGVTTNNVAEYTAVLKAFEYIFGRWGQKGPHNIELKADSLLVIKQMKGEYKIKHPNLRPLFFEIKKVEEQLGEVKYTHVPRAENFIADRLANQALDKEL